MGGMFNAKQTMSNEQWLCKFESYSYRKASIGSSFDAFTAGYKPENNPTKKQIAKPKPIHAQGMMNEEFMMKEMNKPRPSAKIIPNNPPS